MNSRLELHEILCGVLKSRHVYFQPPETTRMEYPAIVYNLENLSQRFADNRQYKKDTEYEVTIIDKNPDSEIPNRLMETRIARFGRSYQADNLNHWVFNVYYK